MIVVVGSVNMDIVASVDEFPLPGETVTATGYALVHGGKGANQAVAAARLGGDVSFVGALGNDTDSDALQESLLHEGIGIEHIQRMDGVPSGTALITVDVQGENEIVVYPGANAELVLTPGAGALVERADVVLLQLEIPMSTVVATAELAKGIVIVNAAPAQVLPEDLIEHIDVLVVNEQERSVAVEKNREDVIPVTITTVGADGAEVAAASGIRRVPAPVTDVLDTTGAGDTFCGALAEALDRGEPIIEAVGWAVRAGALSTRGLGARTAMPTQAEMLDH